MSVQLSQLYIAAMVAGGVLSAGSLLLGDFKLGPRGGWTPRAWLVVLGSGLTWAGLGGLCSVVGWPSVAQRGSVLPAAMAGAVGALIGGLLQVRAARTTVHSAPPLPNVVSPPPPENGGGPPT